MGKIKAIFSNKKNIIICVCAVVAIVLAIVIPMMSLYQTVQSYG